MSIITIKHFNNCEGLTKENVRKRYRELCKKYHPDLNGGKTNDIMAEINSEYELIYSYILTGYPLGTIIEIDDEPVVHNIALSSYHVAFFIRNKEQGYGFVSFTNKRGRIYREKWNYYDYMQPRVEYANIYKTAENDKCDGVRPGFNVYEVLDTEECGTVLYNTVRIVPNSDAVKPANLNEVVAYIMSNQYNFNGNFKSMNNIHALIRNAYRSHEILYNCYEVYESFFGKVYTRTMYGNDDINEAFIVFDGLVIEVPVRRNHLNPKGESDRLALVDIVSQHRFNMSWDELVGDYDMNLPDVAYSLGFKASDIVKDWPLDPILARYVSLNVISVYRHAHLMCGHFNTCSLFAAIAFGLIDLEDIDECQRWFDQKYNELLTKFKSDVKHGRIKLV